MNFVGEWEWESGREGGGGWEGGCLQLPAIAFYGYSPKSALQKCLCNTPMWLYAAMSFHAVRLQHITRSCIHLSTYQQVCYANLNLTDL